MLKSIDVVDYFKECIDNRMYGDAFWIRRVFGIIGENEFFKIEGKNVINTLTGAILNGVKPNTTMMHTNTPVKYEGMDTTVGRVIFNRLLNDAVNGKWKFRNEQFDFKAVENEVKDGIGKKYTLLEYKRANRVSIFLRTISSDIVTSTTINTVSKPKSIDKFKKDLMKRYNSDYKDWMGDETRVLQFEDEMLSHMKNEIKDDETYGIVTSGKLVGQSMKKRYLSVGKASTIGGSKSKNVVTTLLDGLQLNKEDIQSAYNGVRSGSASRGIETQKGGTVFKTLIRLTNGFKIYKKDCGSKKYYSMVVTKSNHVGLIGMYSDKGVVYDREMLEGLFGKVVKMRSPLYCKEDGDAYCNVCCGDSLGSTEGGVAIMAINIGSLALLNALSKFHASNLKLTKVTVDNLF